MPQTVLAAAVTICRCLVRSRIGNAFHASRRSLVPHIAFGDAALQSAVMVLNVGGTREFDQIAALQQLPRAWAGVSGILCRGHRQAL